MDSERFDDLSRRLATPRSRREVLGVLGAAVAGLFAGQAASAAPKDNKPSKCYGGGSHCTNAKQCCSGICTNRQCEPEIAPECAVDTDCPGIDTECQVRTCSDGSCGTENAAAGIACRSGFCNGSGQCVECLTGADCASGVCENNICQAVSSCADSDRAWSIGQPCSVGIGACQRSGVWVCASDGQTVVCSAVPGQPIQEICGNGIDDDCDGLVDENCDVECNPGYEWNGATCVDIDECARELDNCSELATCSNTDGGFTCACEEGFTGNGVVCTPEVQA